MPLKKILSVLAIVLVLITGLFFTFRNAILEKAVGRVLSKAEQKTGYNFQLGHYGFDGILTVVLNDFTATNSNHDTVLSCGKTIVSPSVWRWLLGRAPVKLVQMERLFVQLNLLKLPAKDSNDEKHSDQAPSTKIQKINRLIDRVAGLEGLNIILTDAVFQHQYDDGTSEKLLLSKFAFDHHQVEVHATTVYNDSTSNLHISGFFEPSTLNTRLTGKWLHPTSNGLPFVKKLTGAVLQADSFSVHVGQTYEEGDNREYIFSFFTNNGKLNHPRIGPEAVGTDSLALALTLQTSPAAIKAVSPSAITINRIPLHFSFLLHQTDTSYYSFSLAFDSVPSTAFFESLPQGLFESLQGLQASGTLSYNMQFGINPDQPDSLVFQSHLKGSNFRIKSYGRENFSMMSGSFRHEVRENDRLVRTIEVGPENPMFTPLDRVNPLLVNAIMICEDASFFHHRGFSEKAFRQSIATNIKQKRFARGGSTISMQLVKNVYLSRNKTISRKIEEALIVWLIENNRLVSKERMMEVYLNIIEWGPGIYGVGEASAFYFNKKPDALSLDECIYLASIIPRPKYFKYTFDSNGTLKEYLKPHFDLVTERMVKKEILTAEQAAAMQYNVQLAGQARDIVLPIDSTQTDSLEVEIMIND